MGLTVIQTVDNRGIGKTCARHGCMIYKRLRLTQIFMLYTRAKAGFVALKNSLYNLAEQVFLNGLIHR